MKRIVLIVLLAGLQAPLLRAEAPAAALPASLPKEVATLLAKRCGECHGDKTTKARLSLTTPAGIARGGRKGTVVRPGKPDDSRLWQLVQSDEMPPKTPLPPAERDLLRKWIETGAVGLPNGRGAGHWAGRPPQRPEVPVVKQPGFRNEIDHFIAAALESKKLTLAPESDPATLLRRVAFTLTGLPPTPSEMNAFLDSSSANAYGRMVEHYLASPHYGERWGKHWLDTAGYTDSNGYFNADTDRPLAYKYRDWVIRSFNADMPFDHFVRAQLAGDELTGYVAGGDVTPAMADLLIATHFLRNAPDGSGESDGNPDEVRTDRLTVLEGTLQNTMNALLGITIQCARCHEHKLEPIEHEEYYRLQAIFAPVYRLDHWINPNDRTVAVATPKQVEEHRRRTERVDGQVKALQAGLATLASPYRELLIEERLAALDQSLREAVLAALRASKDKLTAEQQGLLKKHVEPLKIGEDDVAKRFPEFAAIREEVRKAIAARERERPAPLEKLAVAVEVAPHPPAHHLLLRGQHNKPGQEVQPGALAALTTPGNTYTVAPAAYGSGRRSGLAHWVTAPANPVFARVFVNRVWQQHFGKGLVATPDNFGVSGARPSHRELLDWLAVEFIEKGYSVKHLHRLILHSATFRQSSSVPPTKAGVVRTVDPDNRLLSHFSLRRLDAEAIRDAMLTVSGELDRRAGGPYTPTRRTAEGNVLVEEARADARRRSVYLQQRRTQMVTFLELFDAPPITSTCSVRNSSTVPSQALALLNSDFARRRARAFAERLRQEAGPESDPRVMLAFRLALSRLPRNEERTATLRFLDKQQRLYTGKDAEVKTWTDFCQMLLASNGFLYVE